MNRRVGLRGRLLTTYLLLMTLGLSIFVIRYGWIAQNGLIEKTEHEEEIRVFILGNALEVPMQSYTAGALSLDELKTLVDHLAVSVEGRLTLLDSRGNALYDTRLNAAKIPNQLEQIEVKAALIKGEQHDIRFDSLLGDERLFVAAPIEYAGKILGSVQLSIPTMEMWAEIRQIWLSLLGTALAVILVTIIVSLWLATSILNPITSLQKAARRMATGDLKQRFSGNSNDELGQLGQAFNFMATRLERLIDQQRDFVANASHELRTPLTNIKLRVEALRHGAYCDPAVAENFLAEVESETDRLGHLINDLLTLSRIEAGLDTLKMEPVDLPFLLSEAVDTFWPQAETAGITLGLDITSQLPDVRASAPQIRQVIDNLLDNALKYSPPGGSITLSCHWAGNGQTVAVSVTDTGPGIPAGDLPHVFKRFYRASRTRSRSGNPRGTGLGLAIVRSIIIAHNGRISIDSREGKGTTLRFTLPRYSGDSSR